LQFAAELGVPAAALFLALILFALWQGYHSPDVRRKFQIPSVKFQEHRSENPEAGGTDSKARNLNSPSDHLAVFSTLGITVALTTYLLTQMTANALNVYISNQFFFWFLMAALLCARPEPKSRTQIYEC
jgi:O-antigen ligase